MKESDISFTYSARGYMVYYKDEPIYGAGIAKDAKGHRSNLKLFKESAETTKRQLISGMVGESMLAKIKAIDERVRLKNEISDVC